MLPSKKQFKNWSLPSQVSYLAFIFGLFALIIGVGQILNCVKNEKNNNKKDKMYATTGSIEEIPLVDSTKYKLYFGGMGTGILGYMLKEGLYLDNFIVCGESEKPMVKLSVKDGGIKLSATFYDINDQVIGELIENEWRLNTNNYFKRNYDNSAIEVIDNYNVIVIQILFSDERIQVNGVMHCDQNVLIGNNSETRLIAKRLIKNEIIDPETGKSFKETYLDKGRAIKKIFKYSGKDWLGTRR